MSAAVTVAAVVAATVAAVVAATGVAAGMEAGTTEGVAVAGTEAITDTGTVAGTMERVAVAATGTEAIATTGVAAGSKAVAGTEGQADTEGGAGMEEGAGTEEGAGMEEATVGGDATEMTPTILRRGVGSTPTWDSSSPLLLLRLSWLPLSVSSWVPVSSQFSLLELSSLPVSSLSEVVVVVVEVVSSCKSERRWCRLWMEVATGPGDVAVRERAGGAISSPLHASTLARFSCTTCQIVVNK